MSNQTSTVIGVWTSSPYEDHDTETLMGIAQDGMRAGKQGKCELLPDADGETRIVIFVGGTPTPDQVSEYWA